MQISQSLKANNEWKSLLTREDVALVDRMVAITDSMVSVNPVAAGLLKPKARLCSHPASKATSQIELLVSLSTRKHLYKRHTPTYRAIGVWQVYQPC